MTLERKVKLKLVLNQQIKAQAKKRLEELSIMKIAKCIFAVVFCSASLASKSNAAETVRPSYTLNLSVSSIAYEDKDSGQEEGSTSIEKNIQGSMFPNSLEVVIGFELLNLYIYPISEEASLGLGYMINDDWEVGGLIGYNFYNNDGPGDSSQIAQVGLFAASAVDLSENCFLEYAAMVSYSQEKTQGPEDSGIVPGEITQTSTGLNLNLAHFVKVAEGFFLSSGLSYDLIKVEVKDTDRSDSNERILGINLLGVRIEF